MWRYSRKQKKCAVRKTQYLLFDAHAMRWSRYQSGNGKMPPQSTTVTTKATAPWQVLNVNVKKTFHNLIVWCMRLLNKFKLLGIWYIKQQHTYMQCIFYLSRVASAFSSLYQIQNFPASISQVADSSSNFEAIK